jgi:CubicO group peptidase (beta-lactamase class C family)
LDVLRRLQHVVHGPPSERIDAVFADYDSPTTTWIPYSEARIFTSLAVAMLARDGKISLDDPVRRHVPEVPAYAGAVTVRQLVHHTSGLADYGSHMSGPDVFGRMSEDEFFRILARWGKLGFPPGRGHTYSNTDYALLRLLTEIDSA